MLNVLLTLYFVYLNLIVPPPGQMGGPRGQYPPGYPPQQQRGPPPGYPGPQYPPQVQRPPPGYQVSPICVYLTAFASLIH